MRSLILLLIIISSSAANAQNAICSQIEKDIVNSVMNVAVAIAKDSRNSAPLATLHEQEQTNSWLKINSNLLLAQNHGCQLQLDRLDAGQYVMDAMNCNAAIRNDTDRAACNRENWGQE